MPRKKTKIIIDTNLWISFLIGLKTSAAIRNILTDGSVSIVMTERLEREIMAVAARPKFNRYFHPDACQQLLSFLRKRSDNYILHDIPHQCRDPKDDYLLALVQVSDADILVTGDKDLTEMHQFGKCRIFTLKKFQEVLLR